MEYVVDSELLIQDVRKRPIIWNFNHENYRDRFKKREAWNEICEIFFDDFDSKDEIEKNFISKQLELKWRHIRDNYTRELRGKSRCSLKGKYKRRYVYSDQLDFMRNIIEDKFNTEATTTATQAVRPESPGEDDSFADFAEEQNDDDSEDAIELPVKRPRVTAKKHKSSISFEEATLPMERVDIPAREYMEDDDTSFFRSLAPMLTTLSPSDKMKFRIDVMQLLVRYHESTSQ